MYNCKTRYYTSYKQIRLKDQKKPSLQPLNNWGQDGGKLYEVNVCVQERLQLLYIVPLVVLPFFCSFPHSSFEALCTQQQIFPFHVPAKKKNKQKKNNHQKRNSIKTDTNSHLFNQLSWRVKVKEVKAARMKIYSLLFPVSSKPLGL